MRFNGNRLGDWFRNRRNAKRILRQRWHRWFAWHPVSHIHGDFRWLEQVHRQGVYSQHAGKYRFLYWKYMTKGYM